MPTSPGDDVLLRELRSDGAKIGMALFGSKVSDGPLRYFVWDIVIDEQHRGKGFGEAAMRAIELHARKAGAEAVELSVFAGNEPVRCLYLKLGYQPASARMVKTLVGGGLGSSPRLV